MPANEQSLVPALTALIRLVRAMGDMNKAEEIFQPALTALHDIIHVDRSSVLLLDEDDVARFKAWHGLSSEYRAAVEGHFPWRVDDPSPQPIVVEDVEADPSLAPYVPTFRKEGVRGLGFIPLVYREKLVGKFMLYFNHPHVFRTEEVELAQAVAYLVAFAIERARLYSALEDADRRKDAFLATLAHELRNPLAPVSAALALMAERPDDLQTARNSREILERNISQVVHMVDDLLDVSRITRGVIHLQKNPLDLSSTVHHALAAVQRLISEQHHEVTLSLEPLGLEADPVRIEQIIANLIHNAAKYTPLGGRIRIATRGVEDSVEIRIEDNGVGLDPAIIPRLFDLFVQVDGSLARTRGGLGIGLTIVRNLVELHGGTVSARSAGAGKGTEFIVRLPGRLAVPQAAAPEPDQPTHTSAARHILVVDDNEDAATSLAILLDAWGHHVSTVSDGPAALAAVADQHPEIVFLDLGLPGMTGYEVAQHLRESGEKDLTIVALSGYGQAEDIARARAAGCNAHLVKPADLSVLERILEQGTLPVPLP